MATKNEMSAWGQAVCGKTAAELAHSSEIGWFPRVLRDLAAQKARTGSGSDRLVGLRETFPQHCIWRTPDGVTYVCAG